MPSARRIALALVVLLILAVTSISVSQIIRLSAGRPGGATSVPPSAISEPVLPTSPTTEQLPTNTPTATPTANSILARVRDRGYLICGVHPDLKGFSEPDGQDNRKGFDVAFCKAIATAIFPPDQANPNRPLPITFVFVDTMPPTPPDLERFSALLDDKVDIVIRDTTWTVIRNANLYYDNPGFHVGKGVDFGPVIYHDAQRFLIPWTDTNRDPVLQDLKGHKICVATGTTYQQNMPQLQVLEPSLRPNLDYQTIPVTNKDLHNSLKTNICDVVTADDSRLRTEFDDFLKLGTYKIIGREIAREPLAPVFKKGDDQWRNIVDTVIYATIYADELHIDRANVESMLINTTDDRVKRLLGKAGNIGSNLGLDDDFAHRIISEIGNYSDIYNDNFGPIWGSLDPNTKKYIVDPTLRGPNKSWIDSGELISPPF